VEVLWWLVPPLVATVLAMLWVGFVGRERDEVRRDDSEEALARMEKALARPGPRRLRSVSPPAPERTHGVAVRRGARSPESRPGATR
jgi:hypothetical protein